MEYYETTKIRGALRQVARYMPAKKEALSRAQSLEVTGKRGGARYICNFCKKIFGPKDVQVDHINPVIPVNREIKDWNEYIKRLFCSAAELQVLCKNCHQGKTNLERDMRNETASI